MDIYNFMNQKYLEHQKTGKSSIKFPDLKVKEIQIKSLKKSSVDKVYSCGHPSKSTIINTNIETLSLYTEWSHNNPCNFCLNCWIKHRNNKEGR